MMLQILHIPLLFLLWCPRVETTCNPVSVEDMNDAARLSEQSYGDLKKGDAVHHTSGFVVDEVISATLDGEGLKAIFATKQSPKTTIICYRGTNSGEQLKDQLLSAVADKWQTLPYSGNMKVLRYFWDALNKLDVINKVAFSHGTKYILTGHSLGGAMATLLAAQVYYQDNTFWSGDNSLITFGSPRVGNGNFANEHDRIISPQRKLRVVYTRDTVTTVPPLTLGFQHVSTEIFIKVKAWPYWDRSCGYFGCWRWKPYRYDWEVCPIQHGIFTCSKKKLVKFVSDHRMSLYVAAVDNLKGNTEKTRKLYADECSN